MRFLNSMIYKLPSFGPYHFTLGIHSSTQAGPLSSTDFFPSSIATVPSLFMTSNVGSLLTPYLSPIPYITLGVNGWAIQGMVLKYFLNSSRFLSQLQKMTSTFLSWSLAYLYHSASLGVNLRHGGHQLAEK